MTFQNSILSGNTLVREAIESEGFVSGSTGWRVDRDGDAEFNDIDIRGDWTIQGTDPDDFVTGRVVTGTPRIEFASDGVTYALVALSDSQFGERLSIGSLSGATPSISFMETPNDYIVVGPEVHPGPISVWDDGYWHAGNSVSGTGFVKETWTNATLQNSWTTVGVTAFFPPSYKKSPDGFVKLRGVAANGTNANGTTVFTLPAAYRPTERIQLPLTLNAGTALTAVCQVMEIGHASAGQVQIYGVPAGNAIGFDGLEFPIV